MRTDLKLVGSDYSWANSIFYFGYLAGEIPANYLMQKLPIGKFAATNLLIWGVLVMLCAVAKNFAGLAVLRFLMGFFEAGIPPCWIHITGMFYKGQEQGTRCTIWYSMVGKYLSEDLCVLSVNSVNRHGSNCWGSLELRNRAHHFQCCSMAARFLNLRRFYCSLVRCSIPLATRLSFERKVFERARERHCNRAHTRKPHRH